MNGIAQIEKIRRSPHARASARCMSARAMVPCVAALALVIATAGSAHALRSAVYDRADCIACTRGLVHDCVSPDDEAPPETPYGAPRGPLPPSPPLPPAAPVPPNEPLPENYRHEYMEGWGTRGEADGYGGERGRGGTELPDYGRDPDPYDDE
jgi:hypothetical protein